MPIVVVVLKGKEEGTEAEEDDKYDNDVRDDDDEDDCDNKGVSNIVDGATDEEYNEGADSGEGDKDDEGDEIDDDAR